MLAVAHWLHGVFPDVCGGRRVRRKTSQHSGIAGSRWEFELECWRETYRGGDVVVSRSIAVATELQNSSQKTVEPSVRAGFTAKLSRNAFGRMALDCMNWAVVFALVISGYYGAAAIDSGVRLVHSNPAPQHMLATATPAQP